MRLYREDLLLLAVAAMVFSIGVLLNGEFAELTQALYRVLEFLAAEAPHL